MFKYHLGDSVSKENSAYVGLTTTTLPRRLTMHHNDSSSTALHLKTHSIPKSKFRKILVENTTIIAPEIDNLRLQILEALHIKTNIALIVFYFCWWRSVFVFISNSVFFFKSNSAFAYSCYVIKTFKNFQNLWDPKFN